MTALQTEYSLWTRDREDEPLPLLRGLGIGFVPYSPLGHGFLTGQLRSPADIADDDWPKTNPRFIGNAFVRNLRIVDEVRVVGDEIGATSAQVTLAWLPGPGLRHRPHPRHPPSRPCRGEHGRRRPVDAPVRPRTRCRLELLITGSRQTAER
ncbi:aldo/keto reductase [Lentzea sp.]|uniref:aldo/keto reductase n=1 Tax=Lentzea sp. TaxID=56099 RepID=UPI002C0A7617|nr:aldo/keto reductase [Lentzea sp.]HUQ59374.1 aldo/keto reductase [Lentzea sp.]